MGPEEIKLIVDGVVSISFKGLYIWGIVNVFRSLVMAIAGRRI